MRSIEELINRQINQWEFAQKELNESPEKKANHKIQPIVTVSRQRGSRGHYRTLPSDLALHRHRPDADL